jgi:hypothetical protein
MATEESRRSEPHTYRIDTVAQYSGAQFFLDVDVLLCMHPELVDDEL